MVELSADQPPRGGGGSVASRSSQSIVGSLRRAIAELDPVVAQIVLWRFALRSLNDEAIAARVGWPIERVVAASEDALREVWARVSARECG